MNSRFRIRIRTRIALFTKSKYMELVLVPMVSVLDEVQCEMHQIIPEGHQTQLTIHQGFIHADGGT